MMRIKVKKIYSYQTLVYKNGNRTFRKKKYKDYLEEMGSQIETKTYKGELTIHIIFKCVNKVVGDIDNITKPVLDMLQEYNIIENDKQVTELHLKKTFKNKHNEIDILIQETDQWMDEEKIK